MTVPTGEKDIFRAAHLLVKQHGEDAPRHAAERADALLAQGDMEGEATWLRILRAIRVLLVGPDGPSIH